MSSSIALISATTCESKGLPSGQTTVEEYCSNVLQHSWAAVTAKKVQKDRGKRAALV